MKEHLYFCKSILSVIADMGPASVTAWESGDVANLALKLMEASPEGHRAT